MALTPSADILESFDTHHPLVLPDGGYQFQLGREVTDFALGLELDKLNEFISTLPPSLSNEATATGEQKVQTITLLTLFQHKTRSRNIENVQVTLKK